MEPSIIDDPVRYRKFDTGFGCRPAQITRIIDSVHFVQSKDARFLDAHDVTQPDPANAAIDQLSAVVDGSA